ncbi:S-adenosylmethionine decarboxylase proenzyme [bacterium]|nr:S-adenosylmethionine decarboxylase proenzyme [bacterium]
MLFEGCEKKLEVTVTPSQLGEVAGSSLRDLGKQVWSSVVEASQAKILSQVSNEHMDAYLLSESSLFVWDNRFTMITCGETTLIDGAKEFFKNYPIEATSAVIFERKNELYPEKQKTCFKKDVDLLQELFKGNTLHLGQTEGRFISVYSLNKNLDISSEDKTLEVLMYDIHPEVLSLFTNKAADNKALIRDLFSLGEEFKDYQWDDYFFEPFGYSLNAISQDRYFTVHVTPQHVGSYISFETNAVVDFKALINKIALKIKPGKFDVLHFSNDESMDANLTDYNNELYINKKIPCGYELDYYQFVKEK